MERLGKHLRYVEGGEILADTGWNSKWAKAC